MCCRDSVPVRTASQMVWRKVRSNRSAAFGKNVNPLMTTLSRVGRCGMTHQGNLASWHHQGNGLAGQFATLAGLSHPSFHLWIRWSRHKKHIRRKESSTAFNPHHKAYCNTTKPPTLTVGKHVLVEDKDSGAFDIPAVVMSISDTGRSARVKRSETNISLLRNSKGIKIDPHFITPAAPFALTNYDVGITLLDLWDLIQEVT